MPDDDVARAIAISRRQTSSRIVSGTFHELNNSLQILGGIVELLSGRADLPEPVRRKLETMAAHTERAAAAIGAAQELGRTMPSGPARFDLVRLARETLDLRRRTLARAGVGVRLEGDADGLEVRADASAIRFALLAVLLNAEDAVAGQDRAEIVMAIERRGDRAAVSVRDSGPGVASTVRDRIFDRGFSTGGAEAAGLGLWAARLAARDAGGSLSLCDDGGRGCGATFRLELPLDEAGAGAQATECSSSA